MMNKFAIVLFDAILGFAFLLAPPSLEARRGHGGYSGRVLPPFKATIVVPVMNK
jgi:hypothetical protein